jgi:single-stranded DNA-binding protein
MLALTATGYVTGKPQIESGDYGDSCSISLRTKGNSGKHQFYVNAKFYGKKMAVIEKYINDGNQVTVTGTIGAAIEKTRKDGTKYTAIYMTGSDFALPPNGEPSVMSQAKSAPSEEEMSF